MEKQFVDSSVPSFRSAWLAPRFFRALKNALNRVRRQDAQCLHREARVFYFAFKHPRVRWHARIVAGCTVAYILSPV